MKKIAAFAALIQVLIGQATYAGDDDWIVNIQTEELRNQFQYRGSRLTTVAKVNVAYSSRSGEQKMFERLWYADGKPIGLERLGPFALTKAEGAIIEVKHLKQPEVQQEKAAANAILRLMLNAYHNSNAIVYIKLPDDSFDAICNELEKLNCVEKNTPVDEASKAKLTLALETQSGSKERHLYYY